MNEEFYDIVIDGKHYHIKESALNSKSGYHITDENGNSVPMEPGLHTKIQELIESIKRTREGNKSFTLRLFDAGKPFHWSNPSLYRSAYHSEDVIPFLNAMTAGGLNNLSPTLWFGRIVDTVDLLNGNRSFLDWANRTFVTGNSGIFTDLLVAEHPIATAIGNGAIDVLSFGLPSLLKGASNYYRAGQAATLAFNNGSWDYITQATNSVRGVPFTLEIVISPEKLNDFFRTLNKNGYYFYGHGTGRTSVDPETIFNTGLRIKKGRIDDTTIPVSSDNLTAWPHLNSEDVIILPTHESSMKYDAAYGRIPSDWYDATTFQWNDNPGFSGQGFFRVRNPNASFTETTVNGVPGVYTKPESIFGSYNTRTHTLRLNPNSLYLFLFPWNMQETPWNTGTAFWQMPRGALISEAERAGIPKGERNLSVHNTPKADYREESIVESPLSFSEIVKPNLTRLNNLSKDREQFMLENPIYSYPSTNDVTTFQEQLERAMRTAANDPKFSDRNIDDFVKYEALDPEGTTLGLTEGSFFYPDWMDPGHMGIKLRHKEGDNSLLAKLVDSHEVKHFTGNDADAYIYEYLVKNNIIDDSKISTYHKDADHGEIGTHLGELADYYGFTKPTQTSLWLTPQGKTYITAEDVEKFKEFLRENKFLEGSIFENIIDMNKFVEFYNKYKFGFVPTILGASAASTLLDNNNSSSNTIHR